MSHDSFLRSASGESDRREPSFRMSSAQLGMVLLLISLAVVFAASLVGYIVIRVQSDNWRTPEMLPLPRGLWASTALIAGVSAALEWALASVRRNQMASVARALYLAGALAAAFLLGQTFNWLSMLGPYGPPRDLYGFSFYFLTGLHAAHVVGGFVPLAAVTTQTLRREYSSSRHEGLTLCTQYWHFLGCVWIVLLVTLHALG
jgi:cytochrome c oxidase subunit III